MLGWIVYLAATVVSGLVVSFLYSLFFGGIKNRAEKPFKVMFLCLTVTIGGPFAYCEVLTHMYGKDMQSAIHDAYEDSPINGPFKYFKVVRYSNNHAMAYIVGKENLVAGITDDPILEVNLSRKGKTWEVDDSDVLYSYRLNKDGITFPPYQ
jgi:hypothetical protein